MHQKTYLLVQFLSKKRLVCLHLTHLQPFSAKHDFCDDFSEDYFEVHYISVAQNLTILEAILRFC